MAEFVLGERRTEVRLPGHALSGQFTLSAPGLRLVEIVDASSSGVRVRTLGALRPGRTLGVRMRRDARAAEEVVTATVLRCWVQRLGRTGITFEAALHWRDPGDGRTA